MTNRATIQPVVQALNKTIDYLDQVFRKELPEPIEWKEGMTPDELKASVEEYNRRVAELRAIRNIPLPEKVEYQGEMEAALADVEQEVERQGNIISNSLKITERSDGLCLTRDE